MDTGHNASLLIVDDEVPQLQALTDLLSREGYATTGCATAEQALELLGKGRFDLLLSDLRMPGMDGIDLIRHAVAADPELVAVLMTAHASIATAVEAMRTGATDYVLKPFRLDAIRPVLTRALEIRRLRQHNRALQESLLERTQQLEAANRELDSFAGRIAHDLKAPINAISGFAGYVQESSGAALPPDDRELLERIVAAARRAGSLCDDLLSFARLGELPLDLRRVELDGVLAEALRVVEPQAGGKAIEWSLDPLPAVMGDASLLQQVLVNLLSNALKYAGGSDPIRIEVRHHADPELGNVVTVRDNGVGFDPARAHRLFAPFQRLHGATEFKGTGMGLANVKRIIERHGGTVGAESRPGEGATFRVSLPVR